MTNASHFAKKIFSQGNILSFEPVNRFKKMHKIVVFVPADNVEIVTFVMSEAGAGKIGDYSVCSFRMKGEGTFKGGRSTNPSLGKKGQFEITNEVRLEMVCAPKLVDKVITKMLDVHPYEEPAYEIYDIIIGEKDKSENALKVFLKKPVKLKEVFRKLNTKIDYSVMSENTLNKQFRSAVIDLTGNTNNYTINEHKLPRHLIIRKLKSGEFNISFK